MTKMEHHKENSTEMFQNYGIPAEPFAHTAENATSIEMLNYNKAMQHFVYILYLGL